MVHWTIAFMDSWQTMNMIYGLWFVDSHVGGLYAAACLNFIGYIHIFIEGNWLVFGFFGEGDKCCL